MSAQDIIDKAIVGLSSNKANLANSLRRMEERSKLKLENKKLEVIRVNKLLTRESASGPRRSKLLRDLAAAERAVKQEEAYLHGILARMQSEMEKVNDGPA